MVARKPRSKTARSVTAWRGENDLAKVRARLLAAERQIDELDRRLEERLQSPELEKLLFKLSEKIEALEQSNRGGLLPQLIHVQDSAQNLLRDLAVIALELNEAQAFSGRSAEFNRALHRVESYRDRYLNATGSSKT